MARARPVPPGLSPFWKGTVARFAELEPNVFSGEQAERHRIYSLLLLAVIYGKWNGNKHGDVGDYGAWRADQELGRAADGTKIYAGGSYLGHNIAALAVDAEGRIIDFDFNHNQAFDSTVEHAESRLVRRLFALNQIYDPWFALDADPSTPGAAEGPLPYATLLEDVTIYTSLESCAQCSGIMCLGSVKEIVYLQWDQGQFLVGNMMWRATNAEQMGFLAPRPVRGDEFGFEYFARLNDANERFGAAVAAEPFYTGPGLAKPDTAPAITSFLCTDVARGIYADADAELLAWSEASYPDYRPGPSALSNQQALVEARDFRDWVDRLDNRGAAHRV
jgi:tRNA(Arg) A34 adenosine deaminase TadA